MITLTHGSFDNWFTLTDERGRRINGADIEGFREEWAAIAEAIEREESKSFKRCSAVKRADGRWDLSSPRNSINPTTIGASDALALAAEIRRVLAETPVDVPEPGFGDEP